MNSSSVASSSTSRRVLAGIFHQTDKAGNLVARRRIFADQEILIGRDSARCQYTIHDPCVSNKHLRIYTIIYDDENPTEVAPLVYAEDLSRNGTYWNGSLIGKGNGGFLLSNDDTLRLSSSTLLRFEHGVIDDKPGFELTQESEMKTFSKRYVITDRLLGAGAYGKVYMAINSSQRRQLACKIVDLRKLRPQTRARIGREEQHAQAEDVDNRVQLKKLAALADEKKRAHLLEDKLTRWYREVDILASINHPNVVGLEKVFITDNTLYMFQELVTAGDLFSYLESKNGRLMDVEAAVIVRQIVIALKFLHGQNIVHRDIKPDNILMTTLATGCRVVLTDFGGARKIASHRQRMNTLAGTAEYIAPEVLSDRSGLQKGYSKAVDMWALGCVTVVLLTGRSAFRDPKMNEYSQDLADACNLEILECSSDWNQVSTRPKDFVGKLLQLDESKRLTATNALQDPWFSNELNKTDFKELYKRTVRHWQARVHKKPIIEFMNSHEVKHLPCSQNTLAADKRIRSQRAQTPVEPPYKPFPRQMHQPLFPPRRSPGAPYRMSDEVQDMIREHWTSSSSSDDSSEPNTPVRSKSTRYLQPRKPGFKGLQRSPGLNQTSNQNAHPNSMTSTLSQERRDRTSTGHYTRDCNENAVTSASQPEPNRPATPRPRARGTTTNLPLRALTVFDPIANPRLPLVFAPDSPNNASYASGIEDCHASDKQSIGDRLHWTDKEQANSNVRPDTTSFDNTLDRSSPAKANSGLKLRKPKPASLQRLPASGTKKRRRGSIFDIESTEDVEDSEDEHKRPRVLWQTASKAFGRRRSDDSIETLVPHTPSPARGMNPVYLPRL